MATRKKSEKAVSTWTLKVARSIVDDHVARTRARERRSATLVRAVGKAHSLNLARIKAVTSLHRSGDVTLEHYLSAVEGWSSSQDAAVTGVQEWNVINWAKAVVRAGTKRSKDHAMKMLTSSVESLG